MNEELTKAAQQALEALKNVTDYDQINAARRALQAALTQRPAAQTEREAFEAWWESDGPNTSSPYDAAMSGWNAGRASLLDPQQATSGWSYAQVRVVDENTVDIGRVVAFADEQATPEPVGERWVVVRETSLDVGEGNDVRTGGRPELGYALISDAATFGSEDAAVAAIKSASLPVGWVVLPLSRLLPDLDDTHPAAGKGGKNE